MIDFIEPNALINATAKELETVTVMPEWATFVKTGISKQRPPVNENWWCVRAAAVLRTVEMRGPIGVAKLRTKYGGKKNMGMAPERFAKGSGKILRVILQQLETAGLVEKGERGVHKGRVITPKGKSVLFSVSKKLSGDSKKKAAPKKAAKVEEAKPAEAKVEEAKAKPAKAEAKAEPVKETKEAQ